MKIYYLLIVLCFLYTSVYAGCTEKEEVEMLNAGVSLEYIKNITKNLMKLKKNKNDNIINIEKTEEVEPGNSVEIEKIDIKDYLNEDDKKIESYQFFRFKTCRSRSTDQYWFSYYGNRNKFRRYLFFRRTELY